MVYSVVPRGPLDLLPLPGKTKINGKAENFMQGLLEVHKTVHDNLLMATGKYKQAADKK